MAIELAPHNPYSLTISRPLLSAAGCFGYGVEYARMLDSAQLGAIVTRSTSLRPRRSAEPPRLIETPAGTLRTDGWPNPGLRYVLEHYAPIWATWSVPVILSITGSQPDDYTDIAVELEGMSGIAGLELAIESAEQAVPVTHATRQVCRLPLLVKLPALESGLETLASATVAAGADALTIAGSPRGMVIDPVSGQRTEGWLSGPALRPLALRQVAHVAAAVNVPIIGCGGITDSADVRQFLHAGATAVQIGTALLIDPFAAARITLS